jgi:hypothetical protein
MVWLAGGPSQLETFDPHPGKRISGETTAIDTNVAGVQFSAHLAQLAEQMDAMTIVRNVISKEGDHQRGAYNVKTGYRPDPTLVHPSIGAVLCHQLEVGDTEIPRHVSILPNSSYGRGGYLGAQFDAYQIHDLENPLPDIVARAGEERFQRRLQDLAVVDRAFLKRRLPNLEEDRMLHQATVKRAVTMMESEQLRAFDITQETASIQEEFGDNAFGRGCLAALRLIEVGVRCIEITLDGWDSHVDNHSIHERRTKQLDPALASLIKHLRARDLLDRTVVVCGGEFGRTPEMNPAGGRDHWPHGFSIALAGGKLRRGYVHGATDPEGNRVGADQGTPVEDIHATILQQFGITHDLELQTPIKRPMRLSQGKVLTALLET